MTRFIPLILFLLLVVALGINLLHTTPAPHVESALVGTNLPSFALPALNGKTSFSPALWQGKPAIVNLFASWCLPCRAEHAVLKNLTARGVAVYGIAWHDKTPRLRAWLKEQGSPYRAVGMDETGKLTAPLGITGVPETLLIAPDGRVVFRHAGPLTDDIVQTRILPLLKEMP